MMGHKLTMPHVDSTVSATRLHEVCEAVAVPNFDWINQPIIAAVDGLAHAAHIPAGPTQRPKN